jgi:NADH-quinone oxidoreductase subunit M
VNDYPLTLVTFLPLLFGLIILAVSVAAPGNGKAVRITAMIGTLATLAASAIVWMDYQAQYHPGVSMPLPLAGDGLKVYTNTGGYGIVEIMSWIPSLHINYLLGIDGISLLMVLMTTLIWPFVVGVSFKEIKEKEAQFYFWVMLMETAVLGVFLSLNLVLFYVFWEAMLIPMYFIIGIWGGPRRIYATVKFFLYTMVGSMVMLVSILALYFIAGSTTFDLPTMLQSLPNAPAFTHSAELLLFFGFFLAFAIKAPLWPFHTWVPDAYSQAPTGGTIMLVALKMGVYGFIRFCLPLFPHAVHDFAPIVIFMSVVGILWAAWVAAMQTDLKRLLAYSSISHIGVIMLAIFSLNNIAISGAVIQMVSHTITTGALFILAGALYARRGTYAIGDYGGLMKVMPAFTAVFMIAVLSSVALPSTAGFTGEILMLLGAFQTHPWAAGFATTAAIWSVVYMLWMFQRVMYGKLDKPENADLPDWTTGEKWALAPLILLIFFIGVYPKPLLDPLNDSVNTIMASMPEDALPATADAAKGERYHVVLATVALKQQDSGLPAPSQVALVPSLSGYEGPKGSHP